MTNYYESDEYTISEEEFFFLTGESDYSPYAKAFAAQYDITLMLMTLEPSGAYYCNGALANTLPTYATKVVDTTGSGDAFTGALLNRLCHMDKPLFSLSADELDALVRFANASGALAAAKKGGIPSIPSEKQIEVCLSTVPLLQNSRIHSSAV